MRCSISGLKQQRQLYISTHMLPLGLGLFLKFLLIYYFYVECIHPGMQAFEDILVVSVLSICLNVCIGCSKEPSHLDSSLEYLHHMYWLKKIENYVLIMSSYLDAC